MRLQHKCAGECFETLQVGMLMSPLPNGCVLNGKFEILDYLASGSFGVTYRARDTILGRLVAIKELFPRGSTRDGFSVLPNPALGDFSYFRELVRREGAALAAVDHPNVVKIFEAFEQNETVYLVMELLDGDTLLHEVMSHGGRVDWTYLLSLVEQFCRGLEEVHSKGLLHRDIKPSNLFVTKAGVAKLIDFGSVRSTMADGAVTRIFTEDFAPPEQLAGTERLSEQTDIFSLAVTVYFAASGLMPATVNQRISGSRLVRLDELNSDIPRDVADLIEQSLSFQQHERPASIGEFGQRISSTIFRAPDGGTKIVSQRLPGPTVVERFPAKPATKRFTKGKKWAIFCCVACVLVAVFLTIGPDIGGGRKDDGGVIALPTTTRSVTTDTVAVVPATRVLSSIASSTTSLPTGRPAVQLSLPTPELSLRASSPVSPIEASGQAPSVSGDGTRFAYVSSKADAGNTSASPEDLAEIVIATLADWENAIPVTSNTAADLDPSFSRDGNRLAYWSRRDGDSQVYVKDLRTDEEVSIGLSTANEQFPSFLPDGDLAYLGDESGTPKIYRWNSASQKSTLLVDPTQLSTVSGLPLSFEVSSDGFLLFTTVTDASNTRLWLIDLNTPAAPAMPLTTGSQRDERAKFVPSTGLILFASNRSGSSHLYVMRRDGSDITPLSASDSEEEFMPSISGDGRKILFVQREKKSGTIRVVQARLDWSV